MTEKMRDPLGAWQWMSPEGNCLASFFGSFFSPFFLAAQLGDSYSEKCDLYSFAIVVWEIFSGEFPFAEFAAVK